MPVDRFGQQRPAPSGKTIKKIAKKVAPIAKKVAPVTGKVVGGALGGPSGSRSS